MISMAKPVTAARAAVQKCAATVENENLRLRLGTIEDALHAAEEHYRGCGARGELYTIGDSAAVGTVSRTEMIWLYDKKLSRQGDIAREIYDTIKLAAKHGICPLCGHRDASQLDHYLAKARHAMYTVTPLNLVPACAACNKAKLAHQPADAGEQTLHPYFDDVSDAVWLNATVAETAPPVVLFSVSPPEEWPEVKKRRTRTHFSTFKLSVLYAVNAAQALSYMSLRLSQIGDREGAPGVRQHLFEQAQTYAAVNGNSWQAAMYTTLARSEWFCNAGHRLIG